MKKLLTLTFALFFTAGIAFGQTSSDVTQSSSGNDATVTQTNSSAEGSSIYSSVNQSGAFNEATVGQTNTATDDRGALDAYISQGGDYNEAVQAQGDHDPLGDNLASINQSGDRNYASQNQVRYGNDAYITQSGDYNTAKQAQDTDMLPEDEGSMNYAEIVQGQGAYNLAEQTQDGWENDAYALQSGSGNESYQTQESWVSSASVYQTGNYNDATQDQTGNLNEAMISQSSDYNTATQTQTSGDRREGANYDPINEALVYQLDGIYNTATQTQTSPGGNVTKNHAYAWQSGSYHTATQTQMGVDNSSSISQSGSGHTATVTQSN